MSERAVQVGVVGTGGMGERHARIIAEQVPGAEVTALMDVDQGRVERLSKQLGGVRCYDDAHELINAEDVEAVIIASPDFTHAELAVECIGHAKPVLCEKPLATSASESLQVVQGELGAGRRLLQLGFMREYDLAHRRVLQVLAENRLGLPLLFNGVHINKGDGKPRSVEHVITNSVVHDIHSARFMMPGEIVRVNASVIADSEPGSCRYVTVSIDYDDGNLGVIECDAQAGYGYEVSVCIRCERGAVETLNSDAALVRHMASRQTTVDPDWLIRFEQAYVLEVREWVASVQAGIATGPSAWDGYRAMCIADQCIESVNSKQPMDIEQEAIAPIYIAT